MQYLLPALILIPLLGAIVGAFIQCAKAARMWALFIAIATLVIVLILASQFQFNQDLSHVKPQLRMAKSVQIDFGGSPDNPFSVGAPVNFSFHLGMDTISFWLVLLTVFLQPLAVAASFESIKDRAKEYYAWMSLLLMAMLGCFLSRDVLLFYIFFELTLVPMFFIIGIWGGPQRRYAAGKFFLFTFTGSVFTLAGIVYLGIKAGTFDLNHVTMVAQTALTPGERYWIFLAFLAGFSVKVPLFPVHTWLPLAHTEAPTAGSVILAGVLLKLGTYGLLRFAIPMGLPDVTYNFSRFLAVLCIIGVIYGALVAWVQQDIKKLVAYSSVSHLGFCILGLVALNTIGMQGSIMYMINHGLSTGALFLTIGMIYDRFHTRDINELSGLAKKMPKLAFFFVLFAMSSIGLPGLNGFVSEFLTILGAFTSPRLGPVYASFAATGVILGALYMLHMVARVIFGPLKYPGMTPAVSPGHARSYMEDAHGAHSDAHGHAEVSDIGPREISILIPIALAVIILGVMPMGIMRSIDGPIEIIRSGPVVQQQPTPHRSGRLASVVDVKTEKEAL
jgi:NADH-quinone oxidoreductase subunit M